MEDIQQVSNYQSTAILKELSDIKESLAVNTTETANIKSTITEIKIDIRDIKADAVTRREFTDKLEEIDSQFSPLVDTVQKLVEYKSTIRGGMIVLGIFAPIITAVITAWLTRMWRI